MFIRTTLQINQKFKIYNTQPVGRNILHHKGTSTNHCTFPYFYISKYSCTSSNKCTLTYFGMPITNLFPSSSQGYTLCKIYSDEKRSTKQNFYRQASPQNESTDMMWSINNKLYCVKYKYKRKSLGVCSLLITHSAAGRQ